MKEENATCRCGFDRMHPAVETRVGYGFWGWAALIHGASASPKSVTWRCRRCGKIIARSKDPKVLEAFK